ncbi:MAG TPA: serine/threonine-protein kinase, partial [Kofleriaceae bacterium]|nr:serine/threonine-protein kinase [Kofleriaceae bacterium]
MQGRDATMAPIGERIGRFEVLATLGSGAMGMVVEALDPTLGRKVAIKLLHPDASVPAEDGAARLLREAQALARLSHPNVVTIYEAGRDGDQVFLAMELVSGATARDWLAAGARTSDEINAMYRQAAVGLGAAHAAGLVHRDVKPDNILVGDDGRVRVTDFGLVAATGDASTPSPVTAGGEVARLHGDAERGDVLATPL